MTAARAGMMDRTGNRIDFTPLFGGQARGYQRAAGRAGFHDQYTHG